MALVAGEQVGPYEVLSPLGGGAMGEVYRARDPRLGREVAIKLLGESFRDDPERLRRFRDEVRSAGALDHPNVLVVHDVGEYQGAPFLVSEVLDGKTLRARIIESEIPRTQAIAIAKQIAHGLAAIHDAGIVHRDLKPSNLMLVAKDRVKILDFGVARPAPGTRSDENATRTGAVLGTAMYMAPEQVRGGTVDHRADIFAFGVVLYEMVAGMRPFDAESDVETGYKILREEPPPLADPAIDAIVRRCLAKDPTDRYGSAHDLGFALEALAAGTPATRGGRRPQIALALCAAAATGAVVGIGATRSSSPPETASVSPTPRAAAQPATVFALDRLTPQLGVVRSARFAPDGHTIVYSAAWNGGPTTIYSSTPSEPASRELVRDGELLAVSGNGALAILTKPQHLSGVFRHGTLSRGHLQGGTPRELATRVVAADWIGDEIVAARSIQVETHWESGDGVVEWPLGTVVFTSKNGRIHDLRVAPGGERIAIIEQPDGGSPRVLVRDRVRTIATLSIAAHSISLARLAWHPDGREIWVTAQERGGGSCIWALELAGSSRRVQCDPDTLVAQEIAAGGALVTIARDDRRARMVTLRPSLEEQDLQWQGDLGLVDVTEDGRRAVFEDSVGNVYVRDTGEASPVRIATGRAVRISPDGAWVVVVVRHRDGSPPDEFLTPTGAGKQVAIDKQVDGIPVGPNRAFGWPPDSRFFYRACVGATAGTYDTCVFDLEGHGRRLFRGKKIGLVERNVTPDGAWLLGTDMVSSVELLSARGGASRVLPTTDAIVAIGPLGNASVVGWSRDGTAMYVRRRESAPEAVIDRVDVATGRARPWRTLAPTDKTGDVQMSKTIVRGDGDGYIFDYQRTLSALYLMQPAR